MFKVLLKYIKFIFADISSCEVSHAIDYFDIVIGLISYIFIILRISIGISYIIYSVFSTVQIIVLNVGTLRWMVIYYIYFQIGNLMFICTHFLQPIIPMSLQKFPKRCIT